jgi:hypothetical protein
VVSDYQCVGINPANLGFVPQEDLYQLSTPMASGRSRAKRSWSVSVLEGGLSLHSDALDREGLLDMITQTSSESFSREDKIRAATAFADKGVRFSADLIDIGASYQSDGWGGIAMTIRERVSGTFRFNEEAARLAFEGRYFEYFDSTALNFQGDTVGYSSKPKMFSELFDSTRLAMLWFREIGASYGLQLWGSEDLNVYAGVGVKYLMGYALIDAFVDQGELKARSALSPVFGISYGKATSSSYIPGTDFRPIADGWSMDVGLTVRFGSFSFAASAVDLGRMNWYGNVFVARDTILNGMSSTGFNSYNIFEEAPKITGEGNYFKWQGAQDATSNLPARMRFGISYQYSTRWRFGADAIFPFNSSAGALGEPIVSVGADWRPLIWLRTSIGIGGGGNMGAFMPVSILFSTFGGFWELGLASRDVITYFTSDRPVLSLVMGVARFRF